MQAWKKKKSLMRGAKFVTVFEPVEREVLGNLASMVAEKLIERAQSAPKDELAEMMGMSAGHKDAPEDPGLARLLPDFEREGDEEYDGDNSLLRSLHEADITKAKLENLQVLAAAIGPDGGVEVSLQEEEAHAWLGALNDIRLYLASSEVTDGLDRDSIVEWLAYNQESLLEAMMGPLQ